VGLVTGSLLLAACGGGGDLFLPRDGEPAGIAMVRGAGAAGRVGQPLADSLTVQVLDSRHRPVPAVSVLFALTDAAPDASISPDSTVSDDQGMASAAIVLGSRVGPQSGEVRVLTPAGDAAASQSFIVTALPASANGIAAIKGDGQTGPVGTALPDSLVVLVSDAFGNPIEGVAVTWEADGGGSVSRGSVTTGADGQAAVERTLGPSAGSERTLATAEGLAGSPVVFLQTATAGNAARLSIVSGDGQSGPPGEELPDPLVVRVKDADDNPVPGVAITWVIGSGHGSVSPATGRTGDDGDSSTRWTLGPDDGAANSVTAVVSGVGTVEFSATASHGSGGATTTRITGDSPDPSAEGQPVTVQVTVSAAGGTPEGTVEVSEGDRGCTITLHDGAGSCNISLGHAGAHVFTARYGGGGGFAPSSDTESHTVTSQAQPSLSVRTQPSATAESGVPFDRQPVIQLRDGSGHDLHTTGVEVHASIGSGGGSLSGGTVLPTDADGRANFSDLAISGDPGQHTLSFSASGYGSVTSDAITLASHANTPPTARDDGYSVREDQRLDQGNPGLLANDTDPDGDRLRAAVETGPAHGTLSLNDDGGFTYRPDADYNGTDGFTYRVSDGSASAAAGVTIEVRTVNDAPSFRAGGDVQVGEDAGPQSLPGWAGDISAGPADEAGQRLSFLVSSDHSDLFQEQPAISAAGTLSFTSAHHTHGDATVTVTLQDDGGTADGGVDRSPPHSFKIRIRKGH
jgi:VCBS repeat-containing protein